MNKKILTKAIIMILLLAGVYLIVNSSAKKEIDNGQGNSQPGIQKQTDNEEEMKAYVNIQTVEELITKADNGETFNFVFGTDNCPACVYYKEELKKFHEKEGYKFDYLNFDEKTDRALITELLQDKLGYDMSELATPTTFFVINGKLATTSVGAMEVEGIIEYSQYYK